MSLLKELGQAVQEEFPDDTACSVPDYVDTIIVGAGIAGLECAQALAREGIPLCILEKTDAIGGVWRHYAHRASQVNTSEPGYRLVEKQIPNTNHTPAEELLTDFDHVAALLRKNGSHIQCRAEVTQVCKSDSGSYVISYTHGEDGGRKEVRCRAVLLCINRRLGTPRVLTYPGQESFGGIRCQGTGRSVDSVEWCGKRVTVYGMGAFAVENARTALENGAAHVTVVARTRHGAACPRIVDYLTFMRNPDRSFIDAHINEAVLLDLWRSAFEQSGATVPECWATSNSLKPNGHTVSVSDVWFIAHRFGLLNTVIGEIETFTESGITLKNGCEIPTDIFVECCGFEYNDAAPKIIGRDLMRCNGYVDTNFMYMAECLLDEGAHGSVFGTSFLELVRFLVDVFLFYRNKPLLQKEMIDAEMPMVGVTAFTYKDMFAGIRHMSSLHPGVGDLMDIHTRARVARFSKRFDLRQYIAENQLAWDEWCRHFQRLHPELSSCHYPYPYNTLVKATAPTKDTTLGFVSETTLQEERLRTPPDNDEKFLSSSCPTVCESIANVGGC